MSTDSGYPPVVNFPSKKISVANVVEPKGAMEKKMGFAVAFFTEKRAHGVELGQLYSASGHEDGLGKLALVLFLQFWYAR